MRALLSAPAPKGLCPRNTVKIDRHPGDSQGKNLPANNPAVRLKGPARNGPCWSDRTTLEQPVITLFSNLPSSLAVRMHRASSAVAEERQKRQNDAVPATTSGWACLDVRGPVAINERVGVLP
jgi:hypothetical protein